MANSFSGGLFLAITTIHIMPEQVERIKNSLEPNNLSSKIDKNWPFMLFLVGYSSALIIDRIIFSSGEN